MCHCGGLVLYYMCKQRQKALTIFFSTAKQQETCGYRFSVFLGYSGPCPQQVVELVACWRGQFGSHCNIEIWKMIPMYLMWCIQRERNARNIKHCERTVAELKTVTFKSLYVSMAIYKHSHFYNFLISMLLLLNWVLLYTFLVLKLHHYAPFMILDYLSKKNQGLSFKGACRTPFLALMPSLSFIGDFMVSNLRKKLSK